MRIRAIYPGTFDPITNGHLDIIKRALELFDELIIAVALNKGKNPKFSIEDRVQMINECVYSFKNVYVYSFNSLLVDFATRHDAKVIIRGLRAVSDFEFELQMGYANSTLSSDIETIYLMPTLKNAFISSSIVRSVLNYNHEKAHTMMPKEVLDYIRGLK